MRVLASSWDVIREASGSEGREVTIASGEAVNVNVDTGADNEALGVGWRVDSKWGEDLSGMV